MLNILDENGLNNIQGEKQMRLNFIANETLKSALEARGVISAITSEEEDDFVTFNKQCTTQSKYVVLLDPLDGSSNIDVNVSIGTIFSIYRRVTPIGSPMIVPVERSLRFA